jgi:hypothetical protein
MRSRFIIPPIPELCRQRAAGASPAGLDGAGEVEAGAALCQAEADAGGGFVVVHALPCGIGLRRPARQEWYGT